MTVLLRINGEFAAEARSGKFPEGLAVAFAEYGAQPQLVSDDGLFSIRGLDRARERALVSALDPKKQPCVERAFIAGSRATSRSLSMGSIQ